jgi:hypothetical protein
VPAYAIRECALNGAAAILKSASALRAEEAQRYVERRVMPSLARNVAACRRHARDYAAHVTPSYFRRFLFSAEKG